jgi:hypothetical protein
MSSHWKIVLFTAVLAVGGIGTCRLWGQQDALIPSVLHIQRSVTTSQLFFPNYVFMYHGPGGAKSSAAMQALTGTLSLENDSPNFSEVLWLLVYWQGECPADHTNFTNSQIIWTDIQKNPFQSDSKFHVDLKFPQPLPLTGCVALYFGGGPLVEGAVTMSADLDLTYQASSPVANTVIGLGGEYCFGQDWGCENATVDNAMGFGMPITMQTSGHLAELFGNISDSTFDGTNNFGPLPTGDSWGAVNDFYFLPGGCGQFGQNLNDQGFPNPQLLSTLYGWVPSNATHLDSVPMEYKIPEGETGEATLQKGVETTFPSPLTVNVGDCIVVIYGRKGNGATDNETQVSAVLTP